MFVYKRKFRQSGAIIKCKSAGRECSTDPDEERTNKRRTYRATSLTYCGYMLVVVEEADRCALESRKRTSGPRHKLPRYWSGCSIQSVPCPIWVDNVITYIRRGKPRVGHLASCLCMSLVSSERATGSESKQSVLLSSFNPSQI